MALYKGPLPPADTVGPLDPSWYDEFGNLKGQNVTVLPTGNGTFRTGGLQLDANGNVIPSGPAISYSGSKAPRTYENWNNAWNQPYSSPTFKGDVLMGETLTPFPTVPNYSAMPSSPFSAPNPQVSSAVSSLLTRGLLPDVMRQSAEVSAGRGIAGSPSGYSTAVRMTENEYLKRLGLANELLSGEAGRTLPYQITPYQQMQLELEQQRLALEKEKALLDYKARRQYGRNSGGGNLGGGGGGGRYPGGIGDITGWSNLGSGPFGSSGPAGIGRQQTTLDDVYEWLGFGNFGSQSGDWTNPPQSPEEFSDWIGMPPDQGIQTEFSPGQLDWPREFSVYD